jgi:limonene 1,2-monooxygenase
MDNVGSLLAEGKACIGTPDDALAMIERFWQKTGGFGAMLILAHDWANFTNTKKSLEMFARYVMPKFAGRNEWRDNSLDWIRTQREDFARVSKGAAMKMVNEFLASEAKKKGEAAE